jgi:hypothetical protein
MPERMCICVYTNVWTFVHMRAYMRMCTLYVWEHICVCEWVYPYMYVYSFMYARIPPYVCVFMFLTRVAIFICNSLDGMTHMLYFFLSLCHLFWIFTNIYHTCQRLSRIFLIHTNFRCTFQHLALIECTNNVVCSLRRPDIWAMIHEHAAVAHHLFEPSTCLLGLPYTSFLSFILLSYTAPTISLNRLFVP